MVNVRRWSKSQKRYITLPQPQVIHAYNKNMGGVDLTDRIVPQEEGLSSGLSEFGSTFLIWHWQIHGCKWEQPKSTWESLAKTYLNSERSSYNTGKAWLKETINLYKINKDRSKMLRKRNRVLCSLIERWQETHQWSVGSKEQLTFLRLPKAYKRDVQWKNAKRNLQFIVLNAMF